MAPTPRRGRRIGSPLPPEGTAIVVVPVGSWEQHGPHLPFDTDSVIAESLTDCAVARAGDATFVVAPTVAIAASDEHAGFGGLLSAGTEATADALVGIARSASRWARGTVFVNGHGGNADALARIGERLDAESIRHRSWWPTLPAGRGGDLHAGWTETSVMLHLAPDLVEESAIEPGTIGDPTNLIAAMREGGMVAVSANGIVGDPRGATAAHGEEICTAWVDSLLDCLTEVDQLWPHNRP